MSSFILRFSFSQLKMEMIYNSLNRAVKMLYTFISFWYFCKPDARLVWQINLGMKTTGFAKPQLTWIYIYIHCQRPTTKIVKSRDMAAQMFACGNLSNLMCTVCFHNMNGVKSHDL